MTVEQFNQKWGNYLKKGYYGLAIDNEKVIEYLDNIFPILIAINNEFEFSQIKTKFKSVCFYSNAPREISEKIESKIQEILSGS